MKFRIYIAGRGQFAKAIAKQCTKEKVPYSYWDKNKTANKSVILYCGSKRSYKEVRDFCAATKTPLVLLSTNIAPAKRVRFPFYYVPNSSQEVKEFIEAVLAFARHTPYTKVSIIESHQSGKKDVSGTARLIAERLGKSPKIITSIRTPKEQLALGVPRKYLQAHAYHRITFTHDGLTTGFSALVLGREAYARGALDIARQVAKEHLFR